jgi:outer membrane biosynthesis protein TonB
MIEDPKEKKNRRVGILVSIGVHALILVLFAFLLAWRAPDPPLPEYGIEINFGVSEVGSGEVQPETAPVESDSEEEAAPEDSPEQETPAEETPEAVEPVTETAPPVTNKIESPDVIPEKPVEKPVEKPKEKPVEKPKETTKPVTEKTTEATKPIKEAGATGEGTSTKPPAASQGDDTDKTGDKGDEQGELDARALYGKPGGGQGGPALNIVGWIWDEVPRNKDQSNENGTVTFEFMIDEDGYVIFTKTLKSSVSPSVAKFYEDQLKQTTFSRTGSGAVKPGNTKGTVTFSIVSK